MILAIWLFEKEFLHIVSITFTALVFNELLMVALEIITWHRLMVYSEIVTIMIYISSTLFLKNEFGLFDVLTTLIHVNLDLSFISTGSFIWKTSVIIVISSFPLYIIKILRKKYAPATYSKLQNLIE